MNWGESGFHHGSGMALLTALAVVLAPSIAAAQASQRTTPEPVQKQSSGFRVCNKTGAAIEVAKALNIAKSGEPPNIVSEGWYKFAPGECATLWAGELQYRYYLIYGQNKQTGREWKGDKQVCVSREPFSIRHGLCDSSNYRRGFFQVDTGESKSWTQNLND